jgi:outer membrane biosynthesis protein TonB
MRNEMMTKRLMLPLFATAALALAGCSREPAPAPEPTPSVEEAPTPEPTPTAEPTPIATPSELTNVTAALPPEEKPAPDEQMLDDASATGMTARARRDAERD